MIGSKYSVGVSAEQALTKAGQAHLAIVGETRTCAGCRHWLASSPRAREAICAKARATTSLTRPPKVPHNATICKYFEARETKR